VHHVEKQRFISCCGHFGLQDSEELSDYANARHSAKRKTERKKRKVVAPVSWGSMHIAQCYEFVFLFEFS
jgi:hypothetical protein